MALTWRSPSLYIPHTSSADLQVVVDRPLEVGLEFLHPDGIVLAGIEILAAELLRLRWRRSWGTRPGSAWPRSCGKPLVVHIGLNARPVEVHIEVIALRVGPGERVVQRPRAVAANAVDVEERRGVQAPGTRRLLTGCPCCAAPVAEANHLLRGLRERSSQPRVAEEAVLGCPRVASGAWLDRADAE